MLLDKTQRFTCAFALSLEAVGPHCFKRCIGRDTHPHSLTLSHEVVTACKSIGSAQLSFAEAFPKIRANRAAGRRENRKHKIVANHDRRDHQDRSENHGPGHQCPPASPSLSEEKEWQRPKDAKIKRIDSQPASRAEHDSRSQGPPNAPALRGNQEQPQSRNYEPG